MLTVAYTVQYIQPYYKVLPAKPRFMNSAVNPNLVFQCDPGWINLSLILKIWDFEQNP